MGSLVLDVNVRIDRMPQTHETVLTDSVELSAGGKGLCQAVAARRLGAAVDIVGLIGDDVFAEVIEDVLRVEGIGHEFVHRVPAGTHLGIPIVTSDGNNRIIGVPRASNEVTAERVSAARDVLTRARLLLVQSEVPLPAIHAAVRRVGPETTVVWNPAPARFGLEDMFPKGAVGSVAWISPNESEVSGLTGIEVTDPASAVRAATAIVSRYPLAGVVVTLGCQGAVAVDATGSQFHCAAFDVEAIDPTAAGDTFTAAFAWQIASGRSVQSALDFACAAGALATTRRSAVPSIPTLDEVSALMGTGVA